MSFSTLNHPPPFNRLAIGLLAIMGALFLAIPVTAQSQTEAPQDLRILNLKAKEFLIAQSVGSPGKVEVSVTPIDPNLRLAFCPSPEAFFPAGSRAWGKTSVGIRCSSPTSWTFYVQANVSIFADYVVAATPLYQGQVIANSELQMQKGDLTTLPAGIFTNNSQILGRTVKMSLTAGSVIRQDMLKQTLVIQQNQTVRVVSAGNGFSVSTEGQAINTATDGQVVQVRMIGGQVITGTANASGQVVVNAK